MFPVIESDEIFTLDAKEATAENTFILEVSLKSFMLTKVLEDFDCTIITLYCI
jgi:hypothetical protein